VRCGITGELPIVVVWSSLICPILTSTRITIHNASWDYGGKEPRHGTRVTSLAEKPYFDPNSPTRRQALGLLDEDEKEALGSITDRVKDFSL
jgi:hypothetical protein